MKKLLGLLTIAPLALAACGGKEGTAWETIVPIENKEKVDLIDIYKVQDFDNFGTVSATLQYYIDVKEDQDLSDWTWEVSIQLTQETVGRSLLALGLIKDDDITTDIRYELGFDLNASRKAEFELSLDVAGLLEALEVTRIDDFHNDEDRYEEMAKAYAELSSTASQGEIADMRNRFSYIAQTANATLATSFFESIDLIATKNKGEADQIEAITSLIIEEDTE